MVHTFESSVMRLRRWILAFVVGVTLHAGAIFAALYTAPQIEDDTDYSGPIALELAPMPVTNTVEDLDLLIGPQAEQSADSVATPKQEVETTKTEDVPELSTTEHEPDDADLKFAQKITKEDEKEPEEEEPKKIEMEQTEASTYVPESTAPPPIEAEKGEKSAAPEAGLDKTQKKALERWQRRIVAHLAKFKRYPPSARASRREGTVVMSFSIDRSGNVTRKGVTKGSGSGILDEAALEILRKASPLPPPPSSIDNDEFNLNLPVEYNIKK